MVEGFNHLVGEQSHLLSLELAVWLELEHVQEGILHQLEDHEQLGLMLERVQEADYVWVTLDELQD